MLIRDANTSDFDEITDIYNYYIAKTIITFEEELLTNEIMFEKYEKIIKRKLPWIVAQKDGVILGYAYAQFWNDRSAYRFSVESSIYLNPEFTGKGLGKLLYEQLLSRLKELGIKNVLGLITVPNEASIALHKNFGFEQVGKLNDVGYKFDKWLSVDIWQLKL